MKATRAAERCISQFGAAMLLVLLAMVAAGVPDDAGAQTVPTTNCFAPVENVASVLRDGGATLQWDCSDTTPSIASHNVAVRLPVLAYTEDSLPRYFKSRNGLFDSVTLIARDIDGGFRTRTYASRQVEVEPVGSSFVAALPEITPQTSSVIAIYERPHSGAMVQVSRLKPVRALDEPDGMQVLLLVALICGFLLMPVMFDLVFYRALKEGYLLWHAVMAGSLAIHLAFGGLMLFAVPFSQPDMTLLSTVSFSVMLVAAVMFSRAFMEKDKLHQVIRKAMLVCAIFAALLLVLRIIPVEAFRPYRQNLYFAGHAPILVVLVAAMVNAWLRGSRSVKFLLVAWTPFFLLGTIRIITHLTPLAVPTDAVWLFRFAAVFEIVVTSIAITDRFITMRRQRDLALETALRMEGVAEHDQLTGLLNRRALEQRFDDLRFKGYDTFALLDLDKFKSINDTHGHTVGDDVLTAVGTALTNHPDRDVRAFRLGGEEFVVLLRGENSLQRMEALRQMIPGQIAARVESLSAPVTASAGAVEVPRQGLGAMQLSDLYARADQLLYDAKAGGRNRMVSEKLSVFGQTHATIDPTAERRTNRRSNAA